MKPSERLAYMDSGVLVVLDELWERVFPTDGSVLSGHFEDGTPIYTMGGSSAEPAKGDAVEWLAGIVARHGYAVDEQPLTVGYGKLKALSVAIEAERGTHIRELNVALAAEKRAHEETRMSRDGWHSTAKDLADKSDRYTVAMGALAMTLDSLPGTTWAGVLEQGISTITSLRAQLTEQSAMIAGLERDRDQCTQVLEQVNAVAEGLRGRIDRAAEMAHPFLDPDTYPRVPHIVAILEALAAPSETEREADVPGVEWEDDASPPFARIADDDDDPLSLSIIRHGAMAGYLAFTAKEVDPCFTRDQVRLTLIPLLERFVRTGKLKGGES